MEPEFDLFFGVEQRVEGGDLGGRDRKSSTCVTQEDGGGAW